jgi:hypothetical protein
MKHTKLIVLGLSIVAVSLLTFVGIAKAQPVTVGHSAGLPANQTVNSMLFASGNSVDVAGTVNGDLYCAGQNVNVSGIIHGDVFCVGQTVTVSGKVDGSVRLAGQTVTINGEVDGSASVAAQTFAIEKTGVIGRDLLGGTQTTTVNGLIKRDVLAGATTLTINGQVGRDISGGIQNLTVSSTGQVSGNLDYASKNQPVVNSGGVVGGTITVNVPKHQPREARSFSLLRFTIFWFFYGLVSLLLASLALVLLFPSVFHEASSKAIKSPGRTALIGLGAIILVPVAIVLFTGWHTSRHSGALDVAGSSALERSVLGLYPRPITS